MKPAQDLFQLLLYLLDRHERECGVKFPTEKEILRKLRHLSVPPGFDFTGEYRRPEHGELFLSHLGSVGIEGQHHSESGSITWAQGPRLILRKVA